MSMFDGLNNAFQATPIARYFEMEERGTTLTREFGGAVATFLTMAYILAVNPRIMADSGGPCVPCDGEGGLFCDAYVECMESVKREYVTSTAIASMFGCCLMGVMSNLPIALAPGMGMNAYFTYSVVGWRGTGDVGFEAAVTAVMIEGIVFLVLAVTGVRYAIIKLVPEPVKKATPAAIGAFLAHLGLQSAQGIGIVVSDIATAVTLGACPEEDRTYMVALTDACKEFGGDACTTSDAYTCDVEGGVMTSATAWMGILGTMIMAIMLAYKSNMTFVVGIGFVTAMSWFRNTAITYFPDTDDGDDRFEYFKKIVSIEPLDKLMAPYTSELSDVAVALITFLYVDFLDTSGTLLALASSMGYVDENGDFPRSKWAFAADAISTMFGSLFGLSPVTSFIESGSGVEAGSRTGLTSVFVGFFFFMSIFFAPIIASIPPWATGGALVLVGSLMSRSLGEIQWHNPTHALSAFLTLIIMPLTYSIAYGLIAGIVSYLIMEGTFTALEAVGIPRPVVSSEGEDDGTGEGGALTTETPSKKAAGEESSSDGAEVVDTSVDDKKKDEAELSA